MTPRDDLGRTVREAWVKWARTQPDPKPSWLAPYDELGEADKEADRQIGEAVADAAVQAETERCAGICEERSRWWAAPGGLPLGKRGRRNDDDMGEGCRREAAHLAAAIRSGS